MARKEHFVSVRPFLPHAIAATVGVVLVPIVIVFGLLALLEPDPPLVLSAFVGVALAIAMMAIGSGIWLRFPQSADIGFADLMLWRWNRRRRAEESLKHGARLLGLDRSGQPVDDVRISPEQQLQVLKDLTAALESKDPYTHGHSQRVERHTYRTAAAMGLSAGDIEDLRKAAALHDVGKIRVPDRILRKAGPLDEQERAVVEEHSVVGAWMVSSVGNADVIAAVRHHHEKWDGTGYPDGLAGTDIPLFARVISVSDAYDAITSTRPYRASSGREDAIGALRAGSGIQFDPSIVETFISALPSRVPVAAGLFLLLGGPGRLFREVGMWLRRLGAGSLTPAAGAAGAAIVLGASVFTPSVVDQAPSFDRSSSTVGTVDTSEDVTVDAPEAVKKTPKKSGKTKEPVRKQRTGARGPARGGSSGTTTGASVPARPSGGNDDGNAGSGGGGGSGGSGGGDNEPTEPAAPPPAPTNGSQGDNDGNRNDERDRCDDDGNAGHGNDDRECD